MIRGSATPESFGSATPADDQKFRSEIFELWPFVLLYTAKTPLMNSTKCCGPIAPLASAGIPAESTPKVLPVKFCPIETEGTGAAPIHKDGHSVKRKIRGRLGNQFISTIILSKPACDKG